MDKENLYDEQIAPELLRLGNICKDNGLSFLAVVEWSPGKTGETYVVQKGASDEMKRLGIEVSRGTSALIVKLKVK